MTSRSSNFGHGSEMSIAESIYYTTGENFQIRQEIVNGGGGGVSGVGGDEFLLKNTLYNNCDNIYTDILIQILNNNTEDLQSQPIIASEDLMEFLMNAFKISPEKHNQLLSIAKSRKGPTFHLNVGIIKIKDLLPRDIKGVLGYFINLYMASNVANQYHTIVEYVPSNPSWDEFFFFPLRGDPKKETLIVEVCKLLNPDQDIPSRINYFGDLKNVLRKIRPPSAPKSFKVIGKTDVPLNSITGSAAIRVWYTFKKGLRNPQKRGSILMQLGISVEKEKRIVAHEHEVLLMRLLKYEQERSTESILWNGKLCHEADAIITQHYIRSGLSENDDFFMKWIAYTIIHEERYISFGLLRTALHEIIKILPSISSAECIQNFWSSVQRILPSCFEVVWKIREDIFKENQGIAMLIDVLGIFQQIESLEIPEYVDLLVNLNLDWLYKSEEEKSIQTIGQVLNESIRKCTTEWLSSAEESFKNEFKDPVREATEIIQNMCFDMHRAINFHHKHFSEIANIKYANILYECYVKILIESCKPTILEACKNLPPLRVVDVYSFSENSNDGDLTTTTVHKQLFEIFLGVKRLVSLGNCLSRSENHLEYHEWFTPVVPFWVETAIHNALIAIKKSIDLDEFKTIDESVHHSSSALDTLSIFYQIKNFWDQINWPNVESMFLFFGRIIDGICRCCIFYATNISAKLSKYNNTKHNLADFEITKEWCVATCNINEITDKLSSFTNHDMGAESIIENIRDNLNAPEAERCSKTIANIVTNCQDNLENEIKILIERMVGEIVCMIQNFLHANIDNLARGASSFEDIFIFLDRNLYVLNSELVGSTFDAMMETLHQTLLVMLYKIAQNSLDTYRPPSFFANLQEVINIMTVCLKNEKQPFSEKTSAILGTLCEFLELHASKTETLIHNYYQEILLKQKNDSSTSSTYGQLTIKANITNSNMLNVTILNGKNLLPESSKKNANTYVKMHFVPPDRFAKIPTQKTAIKSKTIYPLYDEEFKIYLSTPQQQQDDNILVFIVKIQDLFRTSNKYLSECYVSFGEIRASNDKQLHLNLFRPEWVDVNSVIISELEYRKVFDKTAQTFINKLREKNLCKP
ncbi:protein unc-13 homolog 4B-like [Eupeodes corollae]|uniref:protein unc-13 homolog 4B-like n=1 Tax=Eupeodes corollae TaxID=290404 RepID=UPI002490C4FE|nr:protein unc-13 homolog 4B-like [Eupeodes corollae]